MSRIALSSLCSVAIAGLLLTGCLKTTSNQNFAELSAEDLQQTTQKLGQRYERNPQDRAVAMDYARALKASGKNSESIAVLEPLAKSNQDDAVIFAEYGKALASNNQLEPAYMALAHASELNPSDWKVHSARGTVLDQMGQLQEARAAYQQALIIKPGEPSVLSNLAFSFALTRELPQATALIQKAAQHPNADSRVRQNLALITGMSGNLPEAERILRAELPAKEAEANIAMLKSMLKQPNTWAKLKQIDQKGTGTSLASQASQNDDLTASLPTQVDEMGTPIQPTRKSSGQSATNSTGSVIKAPTWEMLMEKPTFKGKPVE